MLLYYGAGKIVEKPIYGMGNPSNDYGLGFYLTPLKEMAELLASKNENGGYVMTFDVELKNLKILNLKDGTKEDVLKWISLLINHRFSKDDYTSNKKTIEWLRKKYSINTEDYDVIIGYRADDSYFAYSLDFVRNDLSLELLSEAMHLGKLGEQVVLISKKAFERVTLCDYYKVDYSQNYKIFRNSTLSQYRNIKSRDKINNTFIRDIIRREGE